MLIDLFGLPGSGKTTLISSLENEGFVQVPHMVSKLYSLIFFVFNPTFTIIWTYLLVRESISTKTFGLMRFKFACLVNTVGRICYAGRSRDKILLLDEGVLQRLLSIYESEQVKDFVYKFVNFTNFTDLVILVKRDGHKNKDIKVSQKRMDKGQEYIKRWKETIIKNSEVIERSIENSKISYLKYYWGESGDNLEEIVLSIKGYNKK
jgi:hypothetical protein